MNREKQKALEAAGWVFEDAEDFLELTAEERCLVELRLKFARGIRALRSVRAVTQTQLAKMMKTSQPRVAKIEAGSPDVSLDQIISGFIVLGGTMDVTLHNEPAFDGGNITLVGRGRGKPSKKTRKVATKK
jgi:predicted XRE-type DNA-binding protein